MKTKHQGTSLKINYNMSGYFFLILIPLIILGFWENYFLKIFIDSNSLSFHFHFHATIMTIWIGLLVVQPILIRKRKVNIHRIIGKISYLFIPFVLVSIIFMIHQSGKSLPPENQLFVGQIQAIMMFLIFTFFYLVAVLYHNDISIHSRAMIVTGLTLLDPTLMRLLPPFIGIMPTILIIFSVFVILIILERKQKSGKWIFPSVLGILVITYIPLMIYSIFDIIPTIEIWPLDLFMRWFYKLPLT